MSELTQSSHMRYCCTCELWGGSRQPANSFMHSVKYDSATKGPCFGPWKGATRNPGNGTCSGWKKWSILK